MASGIYNRLALSATTYTSLVTTSQVAAGKIAVVTVNILNTNTTNVTIRLALSAGATPTAGEFLEYDTLLNASGVIERTGILVPAGIGILVYSSAANVNAIAYGIEG